MYLIFWLNSFPWHYSARTWLCLLLQRVVESEALGMHLCPSASPAATLGPQGHPQRDKTGGLGQGGDSRTAPTQVWLHDAGSQQLKEKCSWSHLGTVTSWTLGVSCPPHCACLSSELTGDSSSMSCLLPRISSSKSQPGVLGAEEHPDPSPGSCAQPLLGSIAL